MSERFRLGNAYIRLPEGHPNLIIPYPKPTNVKAERPEVPEPLEEQPYIYRPNDPFQASVDEARAVASISSSHKPWVKRTWFILFVIGPLVYAELWVLASALGNTSSESWEVYVFWVAENNALILPVWFLYYSIWRRKAKG